MPYQPSVTMVDMQLSHATRSACPSVKALGEQGWQFNKGADAGVIEDFFTIGDLIATGH
jgi:hypothetical protein